MRKAVRNNSISHSRTKQRKQLWKRVVSAMGVVVVFCTVYALVLPAITLSGDPVCGKTVHAHTDDCYRTSYRVFECPVSAHQHDGCEDEWGNLTCGYGEVVLHTHNALCRDASGTLICNLEERQEHFHSDSCFKKDAQLLCKLEERPSHTHDDSCYEISRELICEVQEQEGHTHGESCKETVQNLICSEDHEHEAGCYETVEKLICTQEETQGHTHGEQCYQEKKNLTCSKEEVQGHTHSEQCYQVTETLICAEEEVGPHTHSKDCYNEAGERICGITAAVVHVHGKDCFRTVELDRPELICTIEEHTHEDACFEKQDGMPADQYEYICGFGEHIHNDQCYDGEKLICDIPEHTHEAVCRGTDYSGTANKETPADWEKTMAQAELTGDWRKDLLTIALTQVGYQESKSNIRQESDGTVRGYTRYGQWAEKPYSDWNTLFVSFCMEYAAVKGLPVEADCAKWVEALSAEEMNLYSPYDAEKVTIGDLVFIDENEDGVADRVAVIAEVVRPADQSGMTLKTVTGDLNGSVDYLGIDLTDARLIGYLDLSAAQKQHEANFTLQRVYSDADVTVTVSFRPTANIPEDAVLVVKKIDSKAQPEAYEDHYRQATELLGESASANIQNFQLYDISFRKGDQEIIPAEAVKVDICYTAEEAITENSSISIIHYAEDGLEKPADVISQVDEEGNVKVNFTTDSFSVYAVVAAADEEIGPFTVLFDGQLGRIRYQGDERRYKYNGAERREVKTDVYGYVELPASLTSTGNYNYKINGWYDIRSGTYYGPEMLGRSVKVTADTVFYPDYIAASYDIGQPENVVTNQPDVRDFITTHVFDYNELFNVYSASYTGNFRDLYATNSWEQDNAKAGSMGFLFTDWVDSGNIGRPSDLDDVNMQHSNGHRGEHTNFAGTITSGVGNQTIWDALFTTNDDFIGREYVGEGDWLFSYDDETGYYYYNSALNAAGYNQSEQRFYVYNHTETVDNSYTLHDFLPMNYGQDVYLERDTVVNFWFGMKNEITFYLPEDSGSNKNVSATGEDLQFRFSGDDDVWVFVDGQLILDLGGVHDIVYGEINFANGTYTIGHDGAENTAYLNDGMPGTVAGSSGVTTSNLPKIEGGKEHTLTVYYLERGSSLSNCAMYFNIAPQYELEFIKRDENGEQFLEGAVFQVFEDPECTIPCDLYEVDPITGELTPKESFTTKADGSVICKALLAGRKYYIKEITAPPGYPDMSDYVIQLDFSISGVPTIVVLNSNGDEWIFADSYMFDDIGRRVILNVYDSKYVGGEKEIDVQKVWADGEEKHQGEEVVIRLYANGEFTERYLKLNAENDWKGTFLNLPTHDPDGNEYEYTVQEESSTGYRVQYEFVDEETTITEASGKWVSAKKVENGKPYMFVSGGNALSATSSGLEWRNSKLAMEQGPEGNPSSWSATKSGEGFRLLSGTDRYLTFNYSSLQSNRLITTDTSPGSYPFVWKEKEKLLGGRYTAARVYYITSLNSNGTAANDTVLNSGMPFELYTWEGTQVETTVHLFGWKVTNTPIEDEPLSVTVNKDWDDNVSETQRGPVNVTLYSGQENADGTVSNLLEVATGTISEDTNWTYTFVDLPTLEDGYHYYLVENTGEFDVTYGDASTVILSINNTDVTAARVEFADETTEMTLTVHNKASSSNFPVDKYWEAAVPDELMQDVTVSLYSYNEATGEAVKVQSVVLGDANGWHSEFVDIPRLPDGSFYFVREETQGYRVEYEWPETLVLDNVPTIVGLVQYYNDGTPVEIYVVNDVQYELPSTGGLGTYLYTSGGILLLTAAAFILLYNQSSKRRRGERISP